MVSVCSGFIKTIEDDEGIPDYSNDSDSEEEFQPKKRLRKTQTHKDFDGEFIFNPEDEGLSIATRSWDDLGKYIKRKAKSNVEEKILKKRGELKKKEAEDEEENDPNVEDSRLSDLSLSDDELVMDRVKAKEKKKKKPKQPDDLPPISFEEAPPYDESLTFYDLSLSRPLLKGIAALKFTNPTPIQCATIPIAMEGRDICGCAATGTGKTAAYMLPTLERLLFRPVQGAVTRVLVLVPTRELGVQVYQVSRQLAQFTDIEFGLAVGGLDLKAQEAVLRRSPDVVIATPGRLIDHLKNTPGFGVDSVEVLILDEADRMLDEYFEEQMKEIVKECSRTRQTMLFSATMTEAVERLATVSLTRPVRVFVNSNQNVASNLRQEFIKIRREGDREAILAALLCRTFHTNVMVFVATKRMAHRLHIVLGLLGLKVGELHGDLTQAQRLESLRQFREEETDVLVATDVAARGLDIHGVKTVINFVVPATVEQYIHRVGRTARAGKSGVSVSLAGEKERKILQHILKHSSSVKSRTIPPEILQKYRTKLTSLEPKLKEILDEEFQEKQLAKAEAQASKLENLIKGEEPTRAWFQTPKQRSEEKAKLAIPKKGRAQRRKKPEKLAEERAEREVEKVAAYQARLAKRSRKPGKMKAMMDNEVRTTNKKTKRQSTFSKDLTDVSKKKVKGLRHQANSFQRQNGKEKRRGTRGGVKNKMKLKNKK